jgi:hypothetical protein
MDIGPEWVPGIIAIVLAAVWCGRLETTTSKNEESSKTLDRRVTNIDNGGSRAMGACLRQVTEIDTALKGLNHEHERLSDKVVEVDKMLALIADRQRGIALRLNSLAVALRKTGYPEIGNGEQPVDD